MFCGILGLNDLSILMVCQSHSDYFIENGKGIVFILCSYLHHFRSCFFRVFF